MICDIGAEVPDRIVIDIDRVRQVILNLLSNAIKFTETGEVELSVRCLQQRECNAELEFSLRDTGIGIPSEKHVSIFQAFVQADGSTSRRFGGTGLGLAISARLVELMGGKFQLQSASGAGSRFSFVLNCPVVSSSALQESAPEAVSIANMRILIVDDNEANGRVLDAMSTYWRCRSHVARSGAEALDLIFDAIRQGRPYHAVLLDAHMPGLDGFQVAEIMRSDPRVSVEPIMMLTSSDLALEAACAQRLGIENYLVKPVGQSELRRALEPTLTAQDSTNRRETGRKAPAEKSLLGGLRILVADDNATNRLLASRLLEKHGHTVVLACHGLEAIQCHAERDFDAILMDVQMPTMDGFEATAAIREREKASGIHTPIIALTAHAIAGYRELCLQAGMDGYISKPIRTQEFYSVLESLRLAAKFGEGEDSLVI